MAGDKYTIDEAHCCSPQWVSHKDYEGEGGPCSDRKTIIINPPPEDGKCMICGRHVHELKAFGGPGDPLVGDFSGAKLVKQFREEYPGYVEKSWECRDCVERSGPLWAFHEEDRLGRPLTRREYIEMEHKLNLWLLEMHEESN